MNRTFSNKRIALIPSYEPENVLIDIVKQLKDAAFDVVVVNDGSAGSYKQIFLAAEAYATVLSYDVNQGKGHALKVGFKHILETYTEPYTVVTLDSDGQHSLEDTLRVIAEAEQNENTIVLGGRHWDKNTPLRSRFGNWCSRVVYRLATGVSVHDTQTGLRAFGKDVLPFLIDVKGERFEYEMEVLLQAPKKKIEIIELPIQTIYLDNNSGSHFNWLKDSIRIYKVILKSSGGALKELIKFLLSSFLAFGIDYLAFTAFVFLMHDFSWTYKLLLINVLARVISASVNFIVNYHLVFKSKKSLWKAAGEYFLTALIILIANTCVLHLLDTYLTLNPLLTKPITEVILFVFSWLTQRFFVFKSKRTK